MKLKTTEKNNLTEIIAGYFSLITWMEMVHF